MKVTLNWLKEFVEIDLSPQQLASRLTYAGLEVEGIQEVGNFPETVLVVKILKIEKQNMIFSSYGHIPLKGCKYLQNIFLDLNILKVKFVSSI